MSILAEFLLFYNKENLHLTVYSEFCILSSVDGWILIVKYLQLLSTNLADLTDWLYFLLSCLVVLPMTSYHVLERILLLVWVNA